jgi:hypothetical protein
MMSVSSLAHEGRENVGEGHGIVIGLEFEGKKNLPMSALLPNPAILTYVLPSNTTDFMSFITECDVLVPMDH